MLKCQIERATIRTSLELGREWCWVRLEEGVRLDRREHPLLAWVPNLLCFGIIQFSGGSTKDRPFRELIRQVVLCKFGSDQSRPPNVLQFGATKFLSKQQIAACQPERLDLSSTQRKA